MDQHLYTAAVNGDPAAWESFVSLSTPLLITWARRLGLQDADAADLVQDVFLLLHEKLPEYQHAPRRSFDSWLWTVLRNKRVNHCRRRWATTVDPEKLDDLGGHDPVLRALIEAEYGRRLARRVLGVLRRDFEPTTRRAFWKTAVCGHPAADVAERLGLSVAAVYKAVSRVRKRLRGEWVGIYDSP